MADNAAPINDAATINVAAPNNNLAPNHNDDDFLNTLPLDQLTHTH
jgi:hypothetical protein